MEQIRIDKEGDDYTLYIDNVHVSCGRLIDLTDMIVTFAERIMRGYDADRIIEEWTTFK